MEKKITTPLTKGIVISLVLIVLALISYFMDLTANKGIQYAGYIIFIAAIVWSVYSYGQQIDHNATFGNYFSHGFKVSAIVTVLMILFTVIFILLFPEIKEKGMEDARKSMEAKGTMSSDQINQAIDITQKFFMVFVIGGALVFYLLFGAIGSLIGAGITKKDPHPEHDINQIS